MKALVISDSHGQHANVARLMDEVVPKEKPQVLVHCGDGVRDVSSYWHLFERVLLARGNCDLASPGEAQSRAAALLQGIEVMAVHGHQHHVKRQLDTLLYAAMEAGAQVVCFGHTHTPMAQWHQGILLLNPGALQDGRYALLEIGAQGAVHALLRGV